MEQELKKKKETKGGRIFLTCTLSKDAFHMLRELMDAIGATSQGQIVEQGIRRWYSEEPLLNNGNNSDRMRRINSSSSLLSVLETGKCGKKKKIASGTR